MGEVCYAAPWYRIVGLLAGGLWVSAAQMRAWGSPPVPAGLGYRPAGASGTALGPGIRTPRSGFPHHHHFRRHYWVGYWGPVYYGGYIPFDYDYDYPGYTATPQAHFNLFLIPILMPAIGILRLCAAAELLSTRAYLLPRTQAIRPRLSKALQRPRLPGSPSFHHRPRRHYRQGPEQVSEPTVLVFRDGHKQEVENYAIMGPTLFVLSGRHRASPSPNWTCPRPSARTKAAVWSFTYLAAGSSEDVGGPGVGDRKSQRSSFWLSWGGIPAPGAEISSAPA